MYEYKVWRVDRVVDGDTVDIIIDLGFGLFKKERVRVAGVDTPEKRTSDEREKKLGIDATEYAVRWFYASDEPVIVRTEKDGKYGRMLGYFYRNDECFNEKLIEDGMAWEYDGGTKIDASELESLMILLRKRGFDTWEDYAEQ